MLGSSDISRGLGDWPYNSKKNWVVIWSGCKVDIRKTSECLYLELLINDGTSYLEE